ncbi:hypothetical protein LBBP_01482 [Leptospira borgpetersenii serovar Ballum]|uniref:Uncharacterized protein n=1 Tax=Leptospira borgpetersenii serovar Ballum TaxID=280505 RepID=A0A0S2IQ20_LEPBO|nr:hypothetical protein LBBP_01482 [Leptospira borgpetersenii serovar Ballum]
MKPNIVCKEKWRILKQLMIASFIRDRISVCLQSLDSK